MSDEESQSVIRAVLAADDRRRAASVAGDVETLAQILTPDFTYIHNTGFREGRDPYLARMREGGVEIVALERLAASARRVGGVVLVDGEASMTYRMPPSAPPATFTSLYLAVWEWRDDAWRIRAYASTLIAAEQQAT